MDSRKSPGHAHTLWMKGGLACWARLSPCHSVLSIQRHVFTEHLMCEARRGGMGAGA